MAKAGQISDGDKRRLQAAIEKRRAGGQLTGPEQRLLDRHVARVEEQKQERARREAYGFRDENGEIVGGIRKGEWCEWSGRQVKVLNEQAAKHGLPIGGAVICLSEFVRAFHDFLSANKHRLAGPSDEGGGASAADAFKREQALYTRVKRQRLEERLIPAEEVQELLTAWGELSRRFGERLGREHGFEAQRLYEDYRAECDRLLVNAEIVERKDGEHVEEKMPE